MTRKPTLLRGVQAINWNRITDDTTKTSGTG